MSKRGLALPVAVGVVLLGGLTAVEDTGFRALVEGKLTDSSASALAKSGLDDVKVDFVGRDGKVTASSEAVAAEAGAVVKDVRGVRAVRAFGPDGEVKIDRAIGSAEGASEAAHPDGDEASVSPEPSESAPSAGEPSELTSDEREKAQTELAKFQMITFYPESDVLTEAGKKVVQAAAVALKEHPKAVVRIEGHTDSVGIDEHSQDLSERRAKRVLDELVKLGIEADRLSSKGFGGSRPVVDGPDERNRRVEFVVTN